jgi:hypothetical protein
MRGFGALMAGQCLKALGWLCHLAVALILLLVAVQWLRGDIANPRELFVLGGLCLAAGFVCQWLGRKFSSFA